MNLRRIVIFAILFALLGVTLQLIAAHWVFVARHDSAWSSTDMLLLDSAIWPQILATRLGYTGTAALMPLVINSFGWALIGLAVGAIVRRRTFRSQPFPWRTIGASSRKGQSGPATIASGKTMFMYVDLSAFIPLLEQERWGRVLLPSGDAAIIEFKDLCE
jgi:hypothetical protein